MLSTLRMRGGGATARAVRRRQAPAAAAAAAAAAPAAAGCRCSSTVGLATRRGLAVAAQLSRRRVPAGGAGLVQRAPALSRAEVGALLRRWSSSSPKKGPAGGGGSAMKGASSQPPKLDGWLGMTALEVADATADPWTAFRMRLAVLVQFGCFLYILNNYGLSSTLCQGPSMMPTLNPAGDVVLVEHVTTTLGRLERGHVIVAKSPTDPNAVVCKRILGLPGDTVRLPSLTHNASSAGLFSCEHDHPNTHPPSDHPPSAIRVPTPNRVAYHSRIALCGAGVLCSALHIPSGPSRSSLSVLPRSGRGHCRAGRESLAARGQRAQFNRLAELRCCAPAAHHRPSLLQGTPTACSALPPPPPPPSLYQPRGG